MSKWYVVGKVCGVIASVKVLGLLAIGFCAGVFVMDESEARKKKKLAHESEAYNRGWKDCRLCYTKFDGEETGEYEFGASENAGTKEN